MEVWGAGLAHLRIAFKLARSKQLARYYESRWIEARSGVYELERVKLMLEEEIA